LLERALEVDQQIATANQVQPHERRVVEDAMGGEQDCIPHLFPVAVEEPPAERPPAAKEPLPALSVYPARPSAGQRRAVAGTGTVICGQDGKTVRFTKKCTTCGKHDRSTSTAVIVAGTMRFGFFCPKCRRRMPVEIQGR